MRPFRMIVVVVLLSLALTPAFAAEAEEAEAPAPAAAAPAEAGAATDGRLPGESTVGGRFSEDVQEFYLDLLTPLLEGDNAVTLLNLRGTFLEGTEQELNVGLVGRCLLEDPGVILGANVFYDSRWTEHDNQFDQLGLGIELLSQWVDARANYYEPGDDRDTIDRSSTTDISTRRTSARITTTTTTTFFESYEEALDGYDVEVGMLLPFLPDNCETRVLAGYYDFESDYGNDTDGWRGRVEMRVGPCLILDGEVFEDDDLNGTDFFVGGRVRMPFDVMALARLRNPLSAQRSATGLRARLMDMVNRDFRIRTADSGNIPVGSESSQTVKNIEQPKPKKVVKEEEEPQ